MSQTKPYKKTLFHILFFILSAGLLCFAFYGYHDSQIAQGAGLYIALQLNEADRTLYDHLMDGLGFVLILLTSLLPPICLKKFNPASYLRFICLFLALAPMINPGTLVHIPEHFTNWSIRENLTLFNVLFILDDIMSLLMLLIPLFLILLIGNKQEENYKLRTHTRVILILSAISCLAYFLFPNLSEYTVFLSYYFMLILIFDEGEVLFNKTTKHAAIMWSMYALCGLRSIYRIIVLLQNTHI